MHQLAYHGEWRCRLASDIAGLSVAVTRALLAIPGAIKDLKSILAKSPDSNVAVGLLDRVEQSLVEFCAAHGWLREAKEFHDRLTTLDSMFEGALRETTKAIASGPFNPEAFNTPEARKNWNVAKAFGLLKLFAFAQHIGHICPAPLETDASGTFISGPAWARRMIELRDEIDGLFKQYDRGDQNSKHRIADSLDAFSSIVKTELLRANEGIRNEATKLADEFNRLEGALNKG
jgi:hypothetical protein